MQYASKRAAADAPALQRVRELAAVYPRYGYRRIRILLGRDGHRMHGRGPRAPSLAPRGACKSRASGRGAAWLRVVRAPAPPVGPNHVWAYDFVFDSCADGKQLKCLTVIDEFTRECLAVDVAGSIRSQRVIDVLSRLVSVHGAPSYLRSDNGPELVSNAILKWIVDSGIGSALSDPGKPWQNGADESFNGKLRDECLSMEWFRSRREAVATIETWRRHYNTLRPHSNLDYLKPIAFKRKYTDPRIRTLEATF